VTKALEIGYQSIDTASFYENELEVGQAIKSSAISRKDLFVTTKVWNNEQGYDETLRAFERSLKRLGLDYIDLYLIHWPVPNTFVETYRAIERLYEEKLIRATGVSNHHESHILKLKNNANIPPMVNQVECHPYLQQRELLNYCKKNKMILTAWSPLGKGEALKNPIIKNIAQKHEKTPAQIILKWHLNRGIVAIPKSITPSRIKENFEVFDFSLDSKDMSDLLQLDSDKRFGRNPDSNDFNF